MNKIAINLVLTLLMSMVGLQAYAEWDTSQKIQVNNLFYYLDEENHQAQVTSMPSGWYANTREIPNSIMYNNQKYSVTSIGSYAFNHCTNLISVTIPNSVTSIDYHAFSYCDNLRDVNIPNSVTSIGDNAFQGCGIYSITIPNSVTSIGENVFWYSELNRIYIGSGLTSIGIFAFADCCNLSWINVDESNPKYDSRDNCNAIIETATNTLIAGGSHTVIPNSITRIGDSAFSGCSGLTSITIPNSVTSIGDGAFDECSRLTSLTIGNSVTSIGLSAFYGCSQLSSVTINSNSIVKNSNCLKNIFGDQVTKYVIGEGVTSIGEYVFQNCSSLTTVTIPNSVTSIGDSAFSGCSGLTSITIPNSVTNIGQYAFSSCSSLPFITIPNSVTSIGKGAFSLCSNMTSVTIGNGVTSIGSSTFEHCSSLTSVEIKAKTPPTVGEKAFPTDDHTITLYVPRGSKAAYEAADIWKDFSSIVETSVMVTADDLTMVYGDEVPELTYKIEGGSIAGTPQITCEATSTSPVGTYPIVISKGTIDSDEVTYVDGTLTIKKAPLTIKAKSYTIKQGESLPTFEAYYVGFKNNETSSVLTTQPTIRTTATSASEPGTYEIVVSGAEATNYDISYVKGTLTIEEVNVDIHYEFNGDKAIVVANPNKYQGNVVIPASVNYNGKVYSVTSIGNNAFNGCSGLTSITIPNSVTSIGQDAFFDCSGIKTIDIPNSVTSIGMGAFTNCNGLTSFRFPNQLKTIAVNMLANCHVKSIIIPASVKTIEQGAFVSCQKLKDVYCLATDVPTTHNLTFYNLNTKNVTLHVYSKSVNAYSSANVWSSLKQVVALTQEEIAALLKILVTANDLTMVYGDAVPEFTYKIEGGSFTGTPQITCEATSTSPVGTYPIVISKGTIDNDYVTYVNGKLTITKAPLTITAKSYSIKQGDALPTFEATYEGFKNNETSAVLTSQPRITTTATSASAPGTYEITISGASANNYDITYVKGTLTITKADEVVVTAKSYSRKYGEANPTFEYTTSGATLTGTPSISCEATATSPVGEYDIVVSKGSITNYNVTLVNGKLTVTKAPLTITAKSYTIKQGEALPTFEAEYAGFKNNETDAVLTKKPTITTTATSASEPGTYEIVVSGAEATNYDITYVKGTLTITKADEVVVTAKSYSRKYGEANPTFEYTTSGATLTGTPSISCEATATSPVGEYAIVVSKGSITNYNVTLVNGKLTVTKTPLTITAKSYSIKQGDALPTFEAEYAGFKNNETDAVLAKKPTITTTATSASAPGTYDIVVADASATNYDITYVKGTLTITAAEAVTVTAKSYSRKYGEANPTFEYTTSGATLTGTPSISCEATAKSPVGEYDIVVSKGSITNYNVTLVNGKLTITKAPLTITAKSYTIKQGDALPTFEAEYAGFKNNETSSVLTTQPTIRTTATSASEPGTYEITISGASATNYDITYVKGTLTITAAEAVTVTAKSYSRKYGEANPTFEYTTSGATLTGTPSISCEATAKSPVGEYDIVVSKGSITNYNVTLVNGKLTVTKAPLTITAKSYTIKQGDALPTFEAEYSGFKNNETSAVLTSQPRITTTATSASAPGTYEIVVSGAEAQNYDITYVKGTLTITKADEVVVTAKSYSRKYGEANPSFEYTTSATLTGTPSISCEATATSPVGEYDIVVSKGSITNYNVTLVNGKLTVTKAPLTITAKSYTIKQGEALPTFEAEYAGFKNNETNSVLTTQPTIRTTATSASEPGTYEITISGASATNYDIEYVKGTLTISAVEVEPVTETETTTFSEEVNENTDLSNTIIDNTYYTMNAENGDGYDATEQAIVLNSTTTAEQMNAVQNAQVGDATMQENFNGIVFEVSAGSGVVTVDVKTIGSHVLNVQIGNGAPNKITKSERGKADVPYNVTGPTYVYLYASTSGASGAPQRAAAANSVLLYSYKVDVLVNGISVVTYGDMENAQWYDLNGRKLQGKPTTKGLYIVNGRKVVVK